jgi:hypothetical protein
MIMKLGSWRVWLLDRGCLLLQGIWFDLRYIRGSVLADLFLWLVIPIVFVDWSLFGILAISYTCVWNDCCIHVIYRYLFFLDARTIHSFYLIESVALNGWCVYKCHDVREDMLQMAVLFGLIIALSFIFIAFVLADEDHISDCSNVLSFFVAILDMCAQLCLYINILRSKSVDLTWFHPIKMVIKMCKTFAFILKNCDLWRLHIQNRRYNLCIDFVFVFTTVACVITMVICGISAMKCFQCL